jgi:hypothetical protein
MASKSSSQAARCCTLEKETLMEVLYACDYCSSSYEEHSRCYQQAANSSGRRARSCIIN